MRIILKKYFLKILCIVMSIIMLIAIVGCSNSSSVNKDDILTQKAMSNKKTVITVLVKYAFTINAFEKAVEEKFPDIDIVQVGNYTRDMGIEEYKSRLEHDDLTDIVMTWPLDVGEEYWSDRLMDLSGLDFTNRYNLSMLNDISRDGKLYYLPGPAQVRGIIYNKTLFKEKGWQVPNNFEGFVNLCKTIEQSGMRSLQLGLKNSEVLDTAFVGYGLSDCFSKPQDTKWISEYNKGVNSFGDHFTPALNTFQRLIDEGILQKSDLDVGYADREKMLFNRKCAMVEDSTLLARMGESQTGTSDEFALMPFFNPDGTDWARLYMVCYIGLNKHLQEEKNKEKYNMVMQIMEYISSPEGQEALMGDTGAMFSSLVGVKAPDIPETQDLISAFNQGHYAIFPQLTNAQSALRDGLAGMVRGDTTKETVIKMVDEQNLSPPKQKTPKVLGTATSNFTVLETGNFVTDAMRLESGCDVALFLDNGKDGRYNGKGISGSLYKGDVTSTDIERVFPDLKHGETGTLWKISLTGEDLIKALEHTITVDNNLGGWFYYFSGLRMEYSPTAEPGSRIKKITTEDGKQIDKQKMYTVAVMDETVSEELIKSCEKTNVSIIDLLERNVQNSKTISPNKDGRFKIIN